MTEYEVFVETINPCGGAQHAAREFIDAETDDPRRYVEENGRWPILEETKTAAGDLLFVTGDGHGNVVRYTFTK